MQEKEFSNLQLGIIGYISGFIVRRLLKRVTCPECREALVEANSPLESIPSLSFIWHKNKGGLIFPSKSVIQCVMACDKAFRTLISDGPVPSSSDKSNLALKLFLLSKRYQDRYTDIFSDLDRHNLDVASLSEDFHAVQLEKSITKEYLQLRLQTHAKKYRACVVKASKHGKKQQLVKLAQQQHL